MYLQRERRSPVFAVSAAKSAVLAGCARVLCEREGWRVGRGGAGALRVPGGLVGAVCSAWRSSLWVDAVAPEGGVAKEGRASGASHTGGWGGPASGMFRGTLQLELVN